MSVHRIFTTLGLVVLCLSSAGIASAASVTGAGMFQSFTTGDPLPTTTAIAVSASTGPGGTVGTFSRSTETSRAFNSENYYHFTADVIDLYVVGDTAFGLAVITHTTRPDVRPIGMLIDFAIQDNEETGDTFNGIPTSGNFTVTP